uniref:Large ribosomal subunit protein bL12c n=1 Tax=Dichotomosiphon tuberosus TaxID=118263 RepID=A0A386AWY2_9CHLO|nr:ribosomal protein L12 [Dichotomosiphon tuberosus]
MILILVNEIIEKLKKLTLLEASELVKQIEQIFGVETINISSSSVPIHVKPSIDQPIETKQDTFDVILESVPGEEEKSKRLAIFRILREVTLLGLKEAKELTNSLPKMIKESISKQQAEDIQIQLQNVGAVVKIQ